MIWTAGFRTAVISPYEQIQLTEARGFADQAVRQVLHMAGGGERLRVACDGWGGRCVAGPGDGVNPKPWLVGHARRGHAGQRHDVAMQVGLVGVAAFGRDSGGVFTRGQAVGSMVEADQLCGTLGRQADL